ncbi:hypothetical protein [Streptomyces sp. RerS4]|uniref:hypothetical protein n=1 Tax=Streptomyces sp. RerS4 TaxID=2942449 RepID=UPI00201CAA91|nr:hypothetical protein [Streptomyces sp. RerS4]UQX02986.1 hypothetical protein M4D82_22685 [Streptomyces sp. RerS4]
MNTVSRRTTVRAVAVTACAAGLLALPAAAAFAEGAPAASAPGARRTLVKSVALADGRSTAKVYRVAKDAYQADIVRAGATVATLTSRDGFTGFGNTGELHAALRPDGRLSSWVDGTRPEGGSHLVAGDGHKTGTRGGGHVTPAEERGPIGTADALRLNTLADGPGDGMLLLAAGGGIAAVGAAGLGFAMLRRGRTDG